MIGQRYVEKQLFRTGTFTDMNGNVSSWDAKDLDEIIATYNEIPPSDIAPVVLGHPETNSPAYGWLLKVWRNGDAIAGLMRVGEELASYIERGAYENVSLSIDGRRIMHVGFLGGALPAISGLSRPTLYGKKATKTTQTIDIPKNFFAGNTMEEKLAILETAVANQATQIAEIQAMVVALKESIDELLQQQSEEQPEEEVIASEETTATEELAAQVAQLAKQNNQLSHANFLAFLDSEDIATRITPAVKNQVVATAKSVLDSNVNFAESKVMESLKSTLLAMPKVAPITQGFSMPNVEAATPKKDVVTRYKERKGIA